MKDRNDSNKVINHRAIISKHKKTRHRSTTYLERFNLLVFQFTQMIYYVSKCKQKQQTGKL